MRLPEAADELPLDDAADRSRRHRRARRVDAAADGAVLVAVPRVRRRGRCCCRAAGPIGARPLWQQRQRAADLLAVAAEVPDVPDPARDVARVPAGRVRRAGAARGARPAAQSRRCAWSASTRRRRRRWRRACCSTGSPPTCTRATRRWPSGGPRRWRSTATCCATCSVPRSCASCSTRACSPTSSSSCSASPTGAGRAAPTSCTTCCAGSATSPPPRSTCAARATGARAVARRAASPSGGRSRSSSPARRATPPPTTRPAIATRSGAALPLGLPLAFTDPVRAPARGARRSLRPDARPVRRATTWPRGFGMPVERVAGALDALEADERIVRGEFRPDGVRREWCDVDVLRQLRRRSLAALRREVEPVEPEALARFLPAWHGVPAERRGARAAGRGARRAAGRADRRRRRSRPTCCRRACAATGRPMLDELCTSGEVVWVGAGAIGSERRSGAAVLRRPAGAAGAGAREARRPPDGRSARRDPRGCSAERGASFWGQLRAARRRRPTTSCWPRCGTWCGPARSPTTRWRRCAPVAGRRGAARHRAAARRRAGRGPAG